MTRGYALFVRDILDAINYIEQFVEMMDYEGFVNDAKTRSAVVLQIQVIGEATKNIPLKVRQKYPGIPLLSG